MPRFDNDASMDVDIRYNAEMDTCHCDEAMPSLDPVSEGDDSSHGSSNMTCSKKKRVSWDRIHTREFALVVGDHPLCHDGLPVSLDWQHADNTHPVKRICCQEPLSERKQSYTFPRRLSYEERKQRLRAVSGMTEDQLKNDEIDLVVRTLKESWGSSGEGETCLPFDPTPIADDESNMMQIWDDIISQDVDIDLGDITDFEWTD